MTVLHALPRRILLWLSALLLAVLSVGCSGAGVDPTPAADNAGPVESDGQLSLSLTLEPGLSLDSIGYVIAGPNGFAKVGSIPLANSTVVSAMISGLPPGAAFTISLDGTTTVGSVHCLGSASFAVVAGMATPVQVPIRCFEPGHNGGVVVGGTVNVCPTIGSISANPATVSVGQSLQLIGLAHDSDTGPSPLSYRWSATSGTFDDAVSSSPHFGCSVVGSPTITLTVSDGDPDPTCSRTLTASVTCDAASGGTAPTPVPALPALAELLMALGLGWLGVRQLADSSRAV